MEQILLQQLVRSFEVKLTSFITGERLRNLDSSSFDNLNREDLVRRIICEQLIGIEFIKNDNLNPFIVIEALGIAIESIEAAYKNLEKNIKEFESIIKNLKAENQNTEELEELKELEEENNDNKRYLRNFLLIESVFEDIKNKWKSSENQKSEYLKKPKIKFLAIPSESEPEKTTLTASLLKNIKNIEDQKLLYNYLNQLEDVLIASCEAGGQIKTKKHGNGLHQVGNYVVYKQISSNIRIFFERREDYIFVLGAVKTHGNSKEESNAERFYKEMRDRLNKFLNETALTEENIRTLEKNYKKAKTGLCKIANNEKNAESDLYDLEASMLQFINLVTSQIMKLGTSEDAPEMLVENGTVGRRIHI